MLCDCLLQRDRLQFMRDRHRVMRLITDSTSASVGIDFYDYANAVMSDRPFTERQHFRKLVCRVDVQKGEWDFAEERFERQPKEHVRILTHRPGHGDVLERVVGFAENKNALVLESVEMRTHAWHQLDNRAFVDNR